MLTLEKYQKLYKNLPAPLREIYGSEETGKKVAEIGKKHNLHIDQIGNLSDEVGLVMLGVTPPDQFLSHIVERLKIDKTAGELIANDINQEIFLPIRESLQKVGGNKMATTRELAEQPIRAPATTIFNEKMSKLFRIPREEVDLNHGGGGAGNGSALAPNTNPPPTTDPYRELTN